MDGHCECCIRNISPEGLAKVANSNSLTIELATVKAHLANILERDPVLDESAVQKTDLVFLDVMRERVKEALSKG